ncbi:MAG: ATP-binding cassette domain-containing protein [Clostridia bacterium]|nr:ATP-binding cassette domain-containing protein [Clostridia bacterium]
MQTVIEIKDLTKDYGEGRGIFNINLSINKGEMLGFAGTNGSGKTTTIRNIMGFLKPTDGAAYVNGLEAWTHSSEIVKSIGYVPGEIAFPDLPTGTEFLKSQAEFLGVSDTSYAEYVIEKLQLDPRASLKRMSKGMKQKTAIVAALMADPEIIILDEPTTGLDPLMRDAFLEIIKAEHAKGKTIFMSSHMFEELETTCDRVALIRDGRIEDIAVLEDIRNRKIKEYKIEFVEEADYRRFKAAGYEVIRDQPQYYQVTISISGDKLNGLFRDLKEYRVKFITEVKYNLEKHFKKVLNREKEIKSNVQ